MSDIHTLENGDTLEFYIDKAGDHRWRLKARNGEILGVANDGYSSAAYAEKNFFRDKHHDRVEVYQRDNGEWHWRAVAVNGQDTGSASEGYRSKAYAVENAKRNGYMQAE